MIPTKTRYEDGEVFALSVRIHQLETELAEAKAQVAAVYKAIALKLDKISNGYLAGGHSHRAQMLHALAEETRACTPADAKRQMELIVAKSELRLQEVLRNSIPADPTYFWLHRINGTAARIAALESEGKAGR